MRLLAGMLRIGIALDRTRQGAVEAVTVRTRSDPRQAIDIDVTAAAGADVSLERYTAEQRLTLLEEALDLPVALHFSDVGRALDAASAKQRIYPYWHQAQFPERNPFPTS